MQKKIKNCVTIFLFLLLVSEEKEEEGKGCMGGWRLVRREREIGRKN
jgi:hypothetical protein